MVIQQELNALLPRTCLQRPYHSGSVPSPGTQGALHVSPFHYRITLSESRDPQRASVDARRAKDDAIGYQELKSFRTVVGKSTLHLSVVVPVIRDPMG